MDAPVPPERVPRWRIALMHAGARAFFTVLTRLEVKDLHHIPATGGAVLVFNHLSSLDGALLFAAIRRPKVTALVADDFRDRLLHRFFVEMPGGMWIRREGTDRAALRRAITCLRRGWIVGFAPEGRVSPTGQLMTGQPGPVFLAMHAGVPLLPAAITGIESFGQSLKRLRRPTVSVRFGQPFTPPSREPHTPDEQLRAVTEITMRRVAALLPPEYRGVYADQAGLATTPE